MNKAPASEERYAQVLDRLSNKCLESGFGIKGKLGQMARRARTETKGQVTAWKFLSELDASIADGDAQSCEDYGSVLLTFLKVEAGKR